MKRCNHLRHLNAHSQCTHLSLQTVHQGGDICWWSAAIFGKFSFKHLCIHVWHILLCAMCCDPSNEEAASAEALNSLWLLFTTTLSRCSLVFSLLMFSLFSNFYPWRENVTEPQTENQLGAVCCSQSGTLLCLCWFTGSLTATLLRHVFLSCTCDVQVMENIHAIHTLYFLPSFFQLNLQFICLPCVGAKNRDNKPSCWWLAGHWVLRPGADCLLKAMRRSGMLTCLNLQGFLFVFARSFGLDCTTKRWFE